MTHFQMFHKYSKYFVAVQRCRPVL